MFPNLLEATREYWRKLDELETAYKQGRISIEEVDASVNVLMEELGREPGAAQENITQNMLWLDENLPTKPASYNHDPLQPVGIFVEGCD